MDPPVIPFAESCTTCGREYHDLRRLYEHVKKEHQQKATRPILKKSPKSKPKHRCTKCSFTTSGRNKLKTHYFGVHDCLLGGTATQPIIIPKKNPVKREEIRTKRELQSIFRIPQKLPVKRSTAMDTPCKPKMRSIIIDPAPATTSKPPTTPPREEDSDMLEVHASPEGKSTFSCEVKASVDSKPASTRRDIPLSLTFNLMAHFTGDEVTFDVVDFKLRQPALQKDRKPTFGSMLLPPRSNTTKLISPLPATAIQKKRQKMEE